MKIKISQSNNEIFSFPVFNRLKKMLSPSIGICQEIGYMSRSSVDPFLITIGAELTGVHHLLNRKDPGKGGYHIGGVGFFHDEAMIKTLSESIERYSQLMSETVVEKILPRKWMSYEEMKQQPGEVLGEKYLKLYSDEQFNSSHFPYDKFDARKKLTWVEITSLDQKNKLWVPAQLLFIGYNCLRPKEPWLSTAVTTGTASHQTQPKAILSGISELVQIDSAMAHWYSNAQAVLLELDGRVKHFLSFKKKVMGKASFAEPKFYLLENESFPGFNIACVFERKLPGVPRFAVGLGSNLRLEKALYQAFLEGYGVVGLARLNLYKERYLNQINLSNEGIYDLDSNIAAYGKGLYENVFKQKFSSRPLKPTSALNEDWIFENEQKAIEFFQKAFKKNDMTLFYIDLTTPEAKELGFCVARTWSPQTLPLCFPSAIPKKHPRFKDFGKVVNEIPHPYP